MSSARGHAAGLTQRAYYVKPGTTGAAPDLMVTPRVIFNAAK